MGAPAGLGGMFRSAPSLEPGCLALIQVPSASFSAALGIPQPEGGHFLEVFFFLFFLSHGVGQPTAVQCSWGGGVPLHSVPPTFPGHLPFKFAVSHQSLFSKRMEGREGGQSALNTCHSLVTRADGQVSPSYLAAPGAHPLKLRGCLESTTFSRRGGLLVGWPAKTSKETVRNPQDCRLERAGVAVGGVGSRRSVE